MTTHKRNDYKVPLLRSVAHTEQISLQSIEGGTPFDTLVTMTTSDGYYSTYQARAVIGAAVGGLCPQGQASVPPE
jgi:hypothetical protein